jgi:predicted neuraminidase
MPTLLLSAAPQAAADLFEHSRLPFPEGRINHAPGIIELPSGRILECWYSGTTEANSDVVLLCSMSADAGRTWSASWQVAGPGEQAIGAAERNKSLGNVALYEDAANRLWMIHGVIQRWTLPIVGNLFCVNWYCSRTDAMISLDEGRTWSAPVRLDDAVGALPRAKPLRHPTLGDLVPLYREGAQISYVRALDFAAVHPGQIPSSRMLQIPGNRVIQPSLVLLPNNKVRAFLRDSARTAIRTAVFDPATLAWTKPERTDLPNPDSGIDAFTDDAGEFVLIYNPSTNNRHALDIAASQDGLHFPRRCTLIAANTQGDVAYPVVIRARDGTWHVAYSTQGKKEVHHVHFDAAWLRRCLGG